MWLNTLFYFSCVEQSEPDSFYCSNKVQFLLDCVFKIKNNQKEESTDKMFKMYELFFVFQLQLHLNNVGPGFPIFPSKRGEAWEVWGPLGYWNNSGKTLSVSEEAYSTAHRRGQQCIWAELFVVTWYMMGESCIILNYRQQWVKQKKEVKAKWLMKPSNVTILELTS